MLTIVLVLVAVTLLPFALESLEELRGTWWPQISKFFNRK